MCNQADPEQCRGNVTSDYAANLNSTFTKAKDVGHSL